MNNPQVWQAERYASIISDNLIFCWIYTSLNVLVNFIQLSTIIH